MEFSQNALPQVKLPVLDLFHIWKNAPVEPGDTLSGGSNIALLRALGLITNPTIGYILTPKGEAVIDKLILQLQRGGVFLGISINLGE